MHRLVQRHRDMEEGVQPVRPCDICVDGEVVMTHIVGFGQTGQGGELRADEVDDAAEVQEASGVEETNRYIGEQNIEVERTSAVYKASALAGGKKTFKIGVSAAGEITCKKLSGSKKLSVSKKGKVTVKKGRYRVGKVYKMRVKIYAGATEEYIEGTRTVTINITIE